MAGWAKIVAGADWTMCLPISTSARHQDSPQAAIGQEARISIATAHIASTSNHAVAGTSSRNTTAAG